VHKFDILRIVLYGYTAGPKHETLGNKLNVII